MKDEWKYLIKEDKKDYYLKENPKIIKDYMINKEIIYNNYLNTTSFSGLFSGTRRTIRQTTPAVSTPSQTTQAPISSTTSTNSVQVPNLQGQTYNAAAMWSPESWAGVVYEWNRGVIGINTDGKIEKEKLDGTKNHHADATVRVTNTLGGSLEDTTMPFQAGVDAAEQGIVLFQSEGNNAFIYFPEELTESQLIELSRIVLPRNGFEFSFTHEGQIYEEQDIRTVLQYAVSLTKDAVLSRR